MDQFTLSIGGGQRALTSHFAVLNPANGRLVGNAPSASLFDLDDAVSAARHAFKTWRLSTDLERKNACLTIAKLLEYNKEELARLITLEQGKPLNGMGSRFELGGAKAWAEHTASLEMAAKTIQDTQQGKIELFRDPIGVVGSITPWNWPLMIAIWHIVPALRAGNTVVIKPSPNTPLSTLRFVELINQHLPAGLVNCITGPNEIGAAMSAHQGIDKIVFTGSSATGRKIMASAAETMKRLTLELGGNDAGIVLPDSDPNEIAAGLFWGGFINNGQTCAALKRLYVHDDIYNDVCTALTDFARSVVVGDGMDEASILGPVQNAMQHSKVSGLVEQAKADGARILLGGQPREKSDVLFYPVTLIADAENGMPIVDEEQFGPALPIIRFTDVEEVIGRANDNPNGLGGSVWSRDLDKAKAIARRLECGSAWINKHGAIQPNAPFGGIKTSGLGVEFGEEGLNEYTNIQVVYS